MRHVALITGLVASAIAAGAQKPSQKIERGWPLDMDGAVRIHNYNGSVVVTGWDKDSVAVTAVIGGKMGLFGGGGRRGVKFGLESASDQTAPVADFTVFVPSRARLSVRGAATMIEIRNFAGTVDASALSGRVRISGSVTEITAETMDGDLEVESSPAYFRGKTATGRITWTGSSDDASLNTVSGAITVTSSTLHRARFESISGDVKFTGTIKPDGRVTLDSHGGDVSATLARDARAEVTIDAPKGNVLGTEFVRPAGKALQYASVPHSGSSGTTRAADLVLRSFKGRVSVAQP
jgi:hypothetical protein